MEELKKKILEDGYVIGDDILKVDSFINHQIDTALLDKLGKYFSTKFSGVTKILTIEASGIAFGVGVARYYDNIPMVFAKKSKSKTVDMNNVYKTEIKSFTRGVESVVTVSKKYLNKGDNILIVDDFLAEGNASLGLVDLCKQAGANVVGVAIVIEKGFQGGRKKLEDLGIRVESAAIIDHFEDGKVVFK
ncbi:MAG: xanthine phosphoribosyltransferase [bacterium]|nr:xanthine phosphoribosyltransferase [bacterium]